MRTIFLLSISMFLTFTGCGSPDDGGHKKDPEMYDHEIDPLMNDHETDHQENDLETDSIMIDGETEDNKIANTFCCSNHNGAHCGKWAELANLTKKHGCNGFQ